MISDPKPNKATHILALILANLAIMATIPTAANNKATTAITTIIPIINILTSTIVIVLTPLKITTIAKTTQEMITKAAKNTEAPFSEGKNFIFELIQILCRNRSNYQSNWGYRHLRTGHVDKEVEEEEKALFESTKSSNPLVENVQNYDHLKVEVTNKFNLPVPQIKDTFKDLNLAQCLLDNIDRCGYQKLTIIQRNSIPIISARLNIMASSQTGSGKTASFLIPIIQNLLNSGPPKNDVSKEEFKKSKFSIFSCENNSLKLVNATLLLSSWLLLENWPFKSTKKPEK